MNKLPILLYFLLSILFYSCSQQLSSKTISKAEINVLFIGNSLTYSNNLPDLVKEKAKHQGIKLRTKMHAFANYAIIDHWNEGKVQKLISSKKYDFVIIQQGPSSLNDGREMLIEYGEKYSHLCKLNNSKLCYFMVWPALTNYSSYEAVINNYSAAAFQNDAIILPVGAIWKAHFDSTNNFQYYSSDGFHPSLEGSQRAAEIIVEYLFEHNKNSTH